MIALLAFCQTLALLKAQSISNSHAVVVTKRMNMFVPYTKFLAMIYICWRSPEDITLIE